MQTRPPELIDTAQKLEAAHAALRDAEANHGQKQADARECAIRTDQARQRLSRERETLANAQTALTDALRSDSPTDKHQRAATAARANIDALEILVREAEQAQATAEKEIFNATGPVGRAQTDIANARFHHLIAQYAELMPPVMKIARELLPLSHQLGQSLEQSGLMIDITRPTLRHYTIHEDGSIIFLVR